ncbi:hypothetical protein [Paraburkholderia sp. J76]|uniref:hypothetical protein n=1 Tax=Paraburkholderia sp. J76 TaxID=2805439 RepID=UPI0039F59F3B
MLRADQAGETTFAGFGPGAWTAGVVRYDADLVRRCVSYFGSDGETHLENYPEVTVRNPHNRRRFIQQCA